MDRHLSWVVPAVTSVPGQKPAAAPNKYINNVAAQPVSAVDSFAIFHHVITQQETVVPMETRNANSYLLAFDNTGGGVLGVAVANVSAQAGNVGQECGGQ